MRKFLFLAVALVLVVVLLTAAQPTPASAAGPAYYVVRPGDTLSSIAWQYGMSTWAIANANHLWNPNYIYIGQVLAIPFVPAPMPMPGPMPGPLPYPYPQPMPGPVCGVRVNYGDTLSAIAYRVGVDVWSLARANGIYNLNWIYAGQWLRLPNCAAPYWH